MARVVSTCTSVWSHFLLLYAPSVRGTFRGSDYEAYPHLGGNRQAHPGGRKPGIIDGREIAPRQFGVCGRTCYTANGCHWAVWGGGGGGGAW